MGVEYTYSSTAFDVDGDQIQLQFDWGDGTYSNWSEFVAANTSVSMSHSWNYISTYEVRVIAQDENSTNSSWSPSLEITVSQADSEDEEPVIEIEVTNNETTNQTIIFDASGSYDIDGAIISYHWDFGDGTTGSGKNLAHEYKNPGTYTVILTITDNNGKEYNKTMTVTVGSQASNQSEEKQNVFPFYVVGIVGGAAAILLCLVVFFRKKFLLFFSHKNSSQKINKVGKLEIKIKELKKKKETEVNYEDLSDETPKDYSRTKHYIDSKAETTSEEKKSFDSFHAQQKIETTDIDSVEKMVDDVVLSKAKEKADNLK